MRLELPRTLSAKLLLAILPPVLAAVGAVVLLQYHMARAKLLSAIEREVRSLAARTAENIDERFAQRLSDLLTLAETPLIVDYYRNVSFGLHDEAATCRRELERYLGGFSRRNLVYARIWYLDAAGREVVSVPAGRPAREHARASYFREAVRAGPGGWWVSPLETLAGVGPVVYFSKPVHDERGRLQGALVLCWDLARLREVLSQIEVGRRGRAFITIDGDVVLEGRAAELEGLQRVSAESALMRTPWRVAVEAPLEDFLGPLDSVRDASVLTALAAVLALVAILLLLVRSMTRPIAALVRAVERVGLGDFSHRIASTRSDELGALADSFNEMGERLEENRRQNAVLQSQLIQSEKLSAVGQLISSVAHELNNPLTALSGYVQFAMQDGPPAMRDDFRHAYGNVLRCKKVVDNLLFFVRKSGQERKRLGLNAAAESAVELLSCRLRKTENVRVVKNLSEESPQIVGDFQQIVQVLVNLINNACDAMETSPRRREEKRLTVATGARGGRGFIRVEDNGPGVPPELREKLFQPFFTTKEPGRGTGLGLSICREIVRNHGGEVSYEEAPGGGGAFVLNLPLGSTEELERLAELEGGGVERTYGAVPGKRVLVVDDERDIADLIARLLREDGDDVKVVYGGAEALRFVESGLFDLVISDMAMEQLNGSELHARMAGPGKILFVTGDILNPKVLQFLSSTGSEYLVKPFDIEELRQAARRLLSPAFDSSAAQR